MDVFIEKLHASDAEALFNFEAENRRFFEEMVPARGDEYYNFEAFQKILEALLKEQAVGSSYFYLIKDKHNSILGRINLVDIDKHKKIGFLGYRVGQVHTGKGIANKALKLLLEILADEDVNQIEATTTTNNVASQRVLEKNGFKKIGISDEKFEMNNQELNFIYYSLYI